MKYSGGIHISTTIFFQLLFIMKKRENPDLRRLLCVFLHITGNISQRWRQRETDRRNTTGKGYLAIAVRPEGRKTRKRRVAALFLLLEDHPPLVTKLINCYLVSSVLPHQQNL
ncbi:unnamed protein product [Lactuca saligna]|uniref:Uncharacterized protein n=1 Tax=Lactuca saligna TaxID=75948 RepID=A0AA35YZ20_LACSI|nr:unnamed protein product [Lactuca saligna]